MQKVIYQKKYPKPSAEELEAELEGCDDLFKQFEEMTSNESVTEKDIFKMLNKGAVYVPLPDRVKPAEEFIKTAIDISETYEIDTEIRQGAGTITVVFSFDSGGAMGFLKRAVRFADDISLLANVDGYDIVMILDFCTHAVYRHGRQMRP